MATSVNPTDYFQNVDLLLKIIASILGGIFTLGMLALSMHFKWKKKTDDAIQEYALFKENVTGRLVAGSELLADHTRKFETVDERLDRYGDTINGLTLRMRALVKSHNKQHGDIIDVPDIIS